MMVHGVNSALEIFAASKDGKKQPLAIPTKIGLRDIMQRMGFPNANNQSYVLPTDPTAFYDKAARRFVVAWGSAYYQDSIKGDPAPPLFVCASADSQPLETWTCWALKSAMDAQPYTGFCAGFPSSDFIPDYPQCESCIESGPPSRVQVGWAQPFAAHSHVCHKMVITRPLAEHCCCSALQHVRLWATASVVAHTGPWNTNP